MPTLKKALEELPSTVKTLSSVLPKNILTTFPKEQRPENLRLRAILTADWHTDADPFRDRTDILRKALTGVSAVPCTDALVMAGDITNSGHIKEYRLLKQLFTVYGEKEKAIPQFGNHDCRGTSIFPYFHEAEQLFEDFCAFCSKTVHAPYYYTSVNGFPFIVMGTDKIMHNTMYVSPEQLSWLDRTLALASSTGKPVFVVNHQAPNTRNGIPKKWAGDGGIGDESDKVEEILNKYSDKAVILFVSGHLHKLDGDSFEKGENSIYYLNLPSFEYDDGKGFIADIFDDRIKIYCRNFITGAYIPDYSYEIKI